MPHSYWECTVFLTWCQLLRTPICLNLTQDCTEVRVHWESLYTDRQLGWKVKKTNKTLMNGDTRREQLRTPPTQGCQGKASRRRHGCGQSSQEVWVSQWRRGRTFRKEPRHRGVVWGTAIVQHDQGLKCKGRKGIWRPDCKHGKDFFLLINCFPQ